MSEELKACRYCNGTGKLEGNSHCGYCHGTGKDNFTCTPPQFVALEKSEIFDFLDCFELETKDGEAFTLNATIGKDNIDTISEAICQHFGIPVLSLSDIKGIVAQGWCTERNGKKVMDVDLAEDIAQAIFDELERK